MRPPLKWPGGKARLARTILSHLPAKVDVYHEPFLGAGAVFFELVESSIPFASARLSDINPESINFFQIIQRVYPEPKVQDQLLVRLEQHRLRHSQKHFYAVRRSYRGAVDLVDRAAAFLYINRTGYNGMWRVNSSGGVNTPWGKRDSFRFDSDLILSCSKALQNAEVFCADFASAASAKPGSVVYMDPPYLPSKISEKSFVGYTKDGFGIKEHLALASLCITLQGRRVGWILSSSDNPVYRSIYSPFSIEKVSMMRSIGCRSDSRKMVPELLIGNFKP